MVKRVQDVEITAFIIHWKLYEKNKSSKIINLINEIYDFDNKNKIHQEKRVVFTSSKKLTQNQFGLIFSSYFAGKVFTKTQIQQTFISLGGKTNDLQVRHLGAQFGYPLATAREEIKINNKKYILKNGEMCFVKGLVSGKFNYLKRTGNAKINSNQCADCGSFEGKINRRDGTITKLEKGHKDPSQALTDDNMITLCVYCNKTDKGDHKFLSNGHKTPLIKFNKNIIIEKINIIINDIMNTKETFSKEQINMLINNLFN